MMKDLQEKINKKAGVVARQKADSFSKVFYDHNSFSGSQSLEDIRGHCLEAKMPGSSKTAADQLGLEKISNDNLRACIAIIKEAVYRSSYKIEKSKIENELLGMHQKLGEYFEDEE